MRKKVIIDTDISLGLFGRDVDDALALALAFNSCEIEILGITVNFGNTSPSKSLKILREFLEIFERKEIPVFEGAGNPQELGRINPAVEFILESLKNTPLEVIGLAPLTNLATSIFLLKKEYQKNLQGFYLMGGTFRYPGNVPPFFQAEFNLFKDPLAAKIVFSSNFPVYLIGLDVTSKIIFKRDMLKKFANSAKPTLNYLYKKIKTWFYLNYPFYGGFLLHDVLAVGACIDKNFFKFEKFPVYVFEKGPLKGKTLRLKTATSLNNIFVATDVNIEKFKNFFMERVVS